MTFRTFRLVKVKDLQPGQRIRTGIAWNRFTNETVLLTGKYPVADGNFFLTFGEHGGANYPGDGQMFVAVIHLLTWPQRAGEAETNTNAKAIELSCEEVPQPAHL